MNRTDLGRVPPGPVSQDWWVRGYQSALTDLAAALERGGEEEALAWIRNNRASTS